MTGNETRVLGKIEPAFGLQHANDRHARCHDRGLRIFGQDKIALRSFPHSLRQALTQRVIDFLKNLARRRERLGECLAHADSLASLSGKDECARHMGRQIKRYESSQARLLSAADHNRGLKKACSHHPGLKNAAKVSDTNSV
jgi:hypothetical protein